MKKNPREWLIPAPWGDIALISWGNREGYPMLLIHGRQDSSATFIPLLDLLPHHYHYVALDLPGHGKSDPFPIGVLLQRFHFVTAIEVALKHLGWKEFHCIAHSLGTEQGLFFNAIHPKRIKKFVLLDPGPSFAKLLMNDFPEYYDAFQEYYKNYDEYNKDRRVFSKDKAMASVKRARRFTDEQAEMALSRNLKELGPDLYQLSWDRRLKLTVPLNMTMDYHLELFTKNSPPTLVVSANDSALSRKEERDVVNDFIVKWKKRVDSFTVTSVGGGHDVHLTNPERIAGDICEFLEKDFESVKAKL